MVAQRLQAALAPRQNKTRKLLSANIPDKVKLQAVSRELRALRSHRVEEFRGVLLHTDYKVWVAETKAKIDKINARIRASNHE